MGEKLNAAVTVKLCDARMARGSALAQRKGMCLSEYMRNLLDQAIEEAEAEYRALDSIFGGSAQKGEGNPE